MLLRYQNALTWALIVVALNTLNNLRLLRRPRPPAEWRDPQLVSILVPARNEERNIGRCLRSLLAQDYPRLEILVLDDDSSDGTAAIVGEMAQQDGRLRLLGGEPLPANWHGKAWACYQLARAASGEWLLFTDADTEHASQCVSATVGMARQEGADLLSLFPEFTVESWWERLMLPVIPFALLAGLPLPLVHRSRSPRAAIAFGPFMLFSRRAYWQCGGHAAVQADLVDDLGLARQVKATGRRLIMADGVGLMRVRMYSGLREIWHGISKSVFATLHYSLPVLALAFLGVAAAFPGPFAFLAVGLWGGETSHVWIGLPVLQIVLMWLASLAVARRMQMSRGMAFLRPLTMVVIMLVAVHSAWCARWGRGTQWKGRSYQTEGGQLTHGWEQAR
ncbi:MAG TPA: glycosyltransferase [Anaerolineae bacterium]|nr:glycosyltransferase [Anaerolineae bacterium]